MMFVLVILCLAVSFINCLWVSNTAQVSDQGNGIAALAPDNNLHLMRRDIALLNGTIFLVSVEGGTDFSLGVMSDDQTWFSNKLITRTLSDMATTPPRIFSITVDSDETNWLLTLVFDDQPESELLTIPMTDSAFFVVQFRDWVEFSFTQKRREYFDAENAAIVNALSGDYTLPTSIRCNDNVNLGLFYSNLTATSIPSLNISMQFRGYNVYMIITRFTVNGLTTELFHDYNLLNGKVYTQRVDSSVRAIDDFWSQFILNYFVHPVITFDENTPLKFLKRGCVMQLIKL